MGIISFINKYEVHSLQSNFSEINRYYFIPSMLFLSDAINIYFMVYAMRIHFMSIYCQKNPANVQLLED